MGNAKFAMSVEPGNADLVKRYESVQLARSKNQPTVPSLLGDEKKTNPFLRCDFSEELRKNCGVDASDSDADAFGKVRTAKDNFC
jgi:hydroxyacylglutathione hydrolase